MRLTQRDAMVLYLRCVDGLSFRAIASACQRDVSTVYGHYKHALLALACYDASGNPNAPGIMRLESILAIWTHNGHRALRASEQALDEVQALVVDKARDFDIVAECMIGDCEMRHKHNGMPDWSQWEMRYLNRTGRTSIPNSVYDACRAARYCDADES